MSSLIVYYSADTNNTKDFINKLERKSTSLDDYDGVDKFVLITPTYHFGQVPKPVVEFLSKYYNNMVAVISSGNKNWGQNFAKSGNLISQEYSIPLLYKFELKGTPKDVENVNRIVDNIEKDGWFN